MGGSLDDLATRGYWEILNYAWQLPEPGMVDSQTMHHIQGTRWTLHNASGVDIAQGICCGRCTPDVTLSFIHYIRKLTLHHIMAYDYQPRHRSLAHSNQTTSNQLPQLPKLTRLLGLLSAYMHPADLSCMLSAHAKLTFTSMCPLFVCRMSFPISIPRSSPTSFFVLSYCELTLPLCFVFVQFNASICLLFSCRLFLVMLWACHRFHIFSLCT